MASDRKWVIVRIDGKIAALSTDYRALSDIAGRLSQMKEPAYENISAETVSFEYVWELRRKTSWDDLILFGTDFQKSVWRHLFELTHTPETGGAEQNGEAAGKARLISYSDFADLCHNRAGVRAVAHAIGLNPVSVIIPCHLVIPKESIDKIADIRRKAESTIFKGGDICMDNLLNDKGFDFGEYALGRRLKRELIRMELG